MHVEFVDILIRALNDFIQLIIDSTDAARVCSVITDNIVSCQMSVATHNQNLIYEI